MNIHPGRGKMYNAEAADLGLLCLSGGRPMSLSNENELVLSAQAGDSRAFGSLYDLYFDKIYRYLHYRLQNREVSEDLASQTFLKALQKLGSFDPGKGNFSAWLYRIARNTLFDHYRTGHPAAELGAAEDISSGNLEREVEARLKLKAVKEELERLSPEQKDIVLLRVWDGLSYKEIADILGKTEGSCQMAFSRAVVKLKEGFPAMAALLLLMNVF